MSEPKQSLTALAAAVGISLPEAASPVASYVPFVRSGNLLFMAGQIPLRDGVPAYRGQVGADVTLEQAQDAARLCAQALLAHLNVAIGGDAGRIIRVVRVGGFVRAAADFDQISQVINGGSDLLVSVLGDRGRHARTAVAVTQLPRGVAVEIDAIIEIGD